MAATVGADLEFTDTPHTAVTSPPIRHILILDMPIRDMLCPGLSCLLRFMEGFTAAMDTARTTVPTTTAMDRIATTDGANLQTKIARGARCQSERAPPRCAGFLHIRLVRRAASTPHCDALAFYDALPGNMNVLRTNVMANNTANAAGRHAMSTAQRGMSTSMQVKDP